MIPGLSLTKQAEEALTKEFSTWSKLFRERFAAGGVPWLISNYEVLVTKVETGLEYYFYEYTNDLMGARGALAIIEHNGLLSHDLGAQVAVLDGRLRALSTEEGCLLAKTARAKYPEGQYWWYYRMPKCIVGSPPVEH